MSKPYVRPTAVGAIPGGLVRTRYYDGMLLSQADLDTDQRYWLGKRRLTNRALGHGVVWGLRLELDEQRQQLLLHEGYGIDCCGNDLVIACATRVPTRELLDEHPAVAQMLALAAGQAPVIEDQHAPGEFVYDHPCQGGVDGPHGAKVRAAVMLEYLECPSEPRPVIRDGCGSSRSDGCEYSRVVESSRLVLRPMPTRDPGPIERALEQLAELQAQAPELFPSLGRVLEAGAPPMTLVVRLLHVQPGAEETQFGELELDLTGSNADGWLGSEERSFELPLGWISEETSRLALAFEIRPAAGWLFTDGAIEHPVATDGSVAEINPPHALQLGWRWTLPITPKAAFNALLRDWILAPLFQNGQRSSGSNASISARVVVGWDHDQGRLRILVGAGWQIEAGVVVMLDPASEPPEKCIDQLGLSSAGERMSLTLLAGLAAWLWDELRFDPEQDLPSPELTGPRTLAVWIYMIAWRTLFGADPVSPALGEDLRAELGKLLHELLRMWCEGMIYRGPRCGCSHGITLGSVELDASGRLSRLDIWDGRRHVITGPLINHWIGQFGIEPIDVVAARLAKAICCVASDCVPKFWALPSLPPGDLQQFDQWQFGQPFFTTLPFAEQGVLLSDGCYLTYGPTEPVLARLHALGIAVVEREVVGRARFFALLLAGLRGSKAPATSRYALYSLDGNDGVTAQLLLARPECAMPSEPPASSPGDEQVPNPHTDPLHELIDKYVLVARPAARASVRELVAALSNVYSLEHYYDSPIDPESYGQRSDAEIALAIDVRTVGGLLSRGFEQLVERAHSIDATPEQVGALERVLLRSEHLVGRLVASVITLVPKVPEPFSPELMREQNFIDSLLETLAASAHPNAEIPGIPEPTIEHRIFPFRPLTREQIERAVENVLRA